MKGEFTGRHMALALVAGFGVVIAVNLTLATFAVRGFGGVVVENTYVASQKFNGWLDEAERERALGWRVSAERDAAGRLVVLTEGTPEGVQVVAHARRPLGKPEARDWALARTGPNRFETREILPDGRWLVRLTVASGEKRFRLEEEI